jgi:ubiquinone/menaquinone biosynthesis C-methylase UbiE
LRLKELDEIPTCIVEHGDPGLRRQRDIVQIFHLLPGLNTRRDEKRDKKGGGNRRSIRSVVWNVEAPEPVWEWSDDSNRIANEPTGETTVRLRCPERIPLVRAVKTIKTSSWFWDCYAHCYDGLLSTIPYQRLLDRVVAGIPAGAHTLLDAGCGTGNLLQAIQRRHPTLALHGLDFSEAMLRRANAKLSEAVLTAHDLNATLPYADGAFDVVTCINVLYAVASPERTVAELRRVLKRGGTLVVSGPQSRARMAPLICEQASEIGWWRTIPLLIRLSALVLFNALIFRRGHAGAYHFMDLQAARKLLACETVNSAYAGLNWFANVTKEQQPDAAM